MSDIAKILGQRIRNYRLAKKLTQEKLSELAGCHPAYIGQIERGEKNVTVESVQKISFALGVPLSRLFEKIGVEEEETHSIPLVCYEMLLSKSKADQERIFRILTEIDKYKEE